MKAETARAHGSDEPDPGVAGGVTRHTLAQQLQTQLLIASLCVLAVLLAESSLIAQWTDRSLIPSMLLMTVLPWGVIGGLLWRGLSYHSHARFGAANVLTLYRAAGTALLAGWIPAASQLPQAGLLWLSLIAVFLLSLDGLDGYLARRTRLASAYGARFDMEIDALLTLVISALVWQSGEAGIWILTLGLMRYVFVLAGSVVTALNNPLYPSFRRKLICVVQLATLCAMLSPWIQPPWSIALGIIACLLLTASFVRDTHWLITQSR